MRNIAEDRVFYGLFILGLLLRMFDITGKSLWIDEIYSMRQLIPGQINNAVYVSLIDFQPPLYYTIVNFVNHANGSVFLLRLPSALLGAFTILLVYEISYSMFGHKTACLSAFLTAISPLHIFYSQFARSYSMLVFFSLASLLFFYKIQKTNRNNYLWGAYFISTLSMLYTHYIAFFILFSQAVSLIIIRRTELYKRFTASLISLFILYLPWIYTILTNAGTISITALSYRENSPSIFQTTYILYKYSIGLRRTSLIDWEVVTMVFAPIFAAMFFFGLYISVKNHKKEAYILLSYMFVPLLTVYLVSNFKINMFSFRYLVFILPVYLMFVANGIASILNKKLALLITLGIVFLYAYILYDYYFLIDKDNWYLSVGL